MEDEPMATLYDLKPLFQAHLKPVADSLALRGFTANEVTLLALALSFAAGLLLWIFPGAILPLLLLPLVLLARMALNAIDGMLAREHGQASKLGALLNELCDMASDAALYAPLALLPGVSGGLAVVAAFLAVMTEGAGLAALLVGGGRRYEGPMGKSDRALAYGVLAILAATGIGGALLLNLTLLAIAGLAVWTIVNRVRAALDNAGER
jgi:CDP-diacylglycerol--glycerol-3-phosphate 3-phosphatidyltransferase